MAVEVEGATIIISQKGTQGPTGISIGAVWGNITGTLSDQTDLQAALDLKLESGDNVSELTNDANYITSAGAPVQTVFGRSGTVVAALSDYDASQIDNDSTVTGATVADALDTLASGTGVTSWNSRTGAVVPATNDYDASQVNNDSTVTGTTVADALNTLSGQSGVVSVFGRTGVVQQNIGDYDTDSVTNATSLPGSTVGDVLINLDSDAISNASTVTGTTVTDALDNLESSIPTVPVSSVFGRIGAVVAAASDYDASQIDNDSTVTGTYVSDALDTLLGAIPTVPVDSVFGRTGAVVAAASDYDASQIDNDSTVTGSFVSDALDTLAGLIPANIVQTFNGRTGTVIPASSDYNSTQVDNDSSVAGATVTQALDNLESAIPTVPVDSVFGRTGAVVATASDYDASQVDNDSGVTGTFVSDALDTLASTIAAVGLPEVLAVDNQSGGNDIELSGAQDRLFTTQARTTGHAIDMTLNSLTTGGAISIVTDAVGTGTLVDVRNNAANLSERRVMYLYSESSDLPALELDRAGAFGNGGIVVSNGNTYDPPVTTHGKCMYHCSLLDSTPLANYDGKTNVDISGGPGFITFGCGTMPQGTADRVLWLGGGEALTASTYNANDADPQWQVTRGGRITGMFIHIADANNVGSPEDLLFSVFIDDFQANDTVTSISENDNTAFNNNMDVAFTNGSTLKLVCRKNNSLNSHVEDVRVVLEIQ